MQLAIRHQTVYRYEPVPEDLALRLRLFARDTVQQHVVRWTVSVNGEPVTPLLTTGFGEGEALWFDRLASGEVTVVAEGQVETSDHSGVLGKQGTYRPGIYLRETPLTEPGEAIEALAAGIEGENALARMHALNAAIHEALDYKPGVTDAKTTAEEAATRGAGVCQDFAHLFLATARHLGVPARYVVGYVHDAEAPEQASHAWAEAHIDGLGWVGFDPVHEVCPADAYVRLVTGFDAADAAPIRGTMLPGSAEEIEVTVDVAVAAPAQRQSQSTD